MNGIGSGLYGHELQDEMCIRDRSPEGRDGATYQGRGRMQMTDRMRYTCLLYTSNARSQLFFIR